MKIGIMTFHWAANHGALLQTYALQKALADLFPGSEISIVDYKPAQFDMTLKRLLGSRRIKIFFNNLREIKVEKQLAPFRNRFSRTYRYYSTEQLMRRPPNCDVFIAGSDQIWNESYTMNGEGKLTPAYYLPFNSGAKHISYAASFGTTQLKPQVQNYILPYLQKLDGVSVREKSGQEILDKMGIPSEIVCDPSALICEADYLDLAKPAFPGEYVAKYFLRNQSRCAQNAIRHFRSEGSKVHDVSLLPMEQWLGGIGDAKFLLTNSFHGMMVALKMHVPFAVFLTEGILSGMNDRFYTILEVLGLTNRIVTTDNPIHEIENQPICWEQVDRLMEAYAANSVAFLKKNCVAPRSTGPITHYRNAQCCGCSACEQICPKQCIQMVRDTEGFLYPNVNADLCIHCGRCIKVCPVKNNPIHLTGMPIEQTFVANAKSAEVVNQSSSGGVFSVLAQHVLDKQGVVFSVVMSKDCKQAVYAKAETVSQLAAMRGSKYVQSYKNDVFSQVKLCLEAGKYVLFCGTPCDVNGLYNYLQHVNTSMDNLVLVDFICHGVPSPLVWERYVELREKKMGANAEKVQFRNKQYGWKNFAMSIEFSNGRQYLADKETDPYLKGFLSDLYLRPSCHECAAKGDARVSDITIGDAWGAENYSSLIDLKGTSLIFVNTQRGEALFTDVQEELLYATMIDRNCALKYNKAYTRSVVANSARVRFMATMAGQKNIDKWIMECCRDSLMLCMKKRIKRMIKR